MTCFNKTESERLKAESFEKNEKDRKERANAEVVSISDDLKKLFRDSELYCIASCCQENAFCNKPEHLTKWAKDNGVSAADIVFRELNQMVASAEDFDPNIFYHVNAFESEWKKDDFKKLFSEWAERLEFAIWKASKQSNEKLK